MGHRVTWRDRQRSGYPWPLATLRINRADIPALQASYGALGEYQGLVGPLPMAAVVELLYRVRKVSFAGSFTVDTPDPASTDSYSVSAELTLTPSTGGAALTETDLFQSLQSTIGGIIPRHYSFSQDSGDSISEFFLIDDGIGNFPIYADDLGGFWVRGRFYALPLGGISFALANGVYDDARDYFDATLSLRSGDFSIRAFIDGYLDERVISGQTLTITATEWFPYATTAGADAWDTATGAPVNGGPAT